ncbi:MAG: hypothetical protein LBT29_05885 [Flavobacteriaceae bacterium]|nr:hypothetical protein [Flavobacteriaceae bacterium]
MTTIKDRYLQLISEDFENLSQLSLSQMVLVKKILENKDESLFFNAEENEKRMDGLDLSLRDKIVFAILKFNPKGKNLRFIITHYDIAVYLERIGDLLLNVVHFLENIDFEQIKHQKIKTEVKKMILDVESMLQTAIISFFNHDSEAAYHTLEMDDKIDKHFKEINRNLQRKFSHQSLSETDIRNILNISGISQSLERIGDNATNIAEATVFLVEGSDIRHKP